MDLNNIYLNNILNEILDVLKKISNIYRRRTC